MDILSAAFLGLVGSAAGLRLAWLCMPERWCLVTGFWWMWFYRRDFRSPPDQFLLC